MVRVPWSKKKSSGYSFFNFAIYSAMIFCLSISSMIVALCTLKRVATSSHTVVSISSISREAIKKSTGILKCFRYFV